jgi:hypothetical protein
MDVLHVSREELVEADRSQKMDVVNVEPSKRLKMDELHQDKVTGKCGKGEEDGKDRQKVCGRRKTS